MAIFEGVAMRKLVLNALTGGLMLACFGSADVRAEVLVTGAEAKLPPSTEIGMAMRGLTRGPGIEQLSPSPGKAVTSPVSFRIKFDPRNRVEIDPATVKLIYLKATPVDLTGRIKTHLTAEGIDMEGAELPPGKHAMRIDLKDKQGRIGTAIISFTVSGN
jgi:hypothetical protein